MQSVDVLRGIAVAWMLVAHSHYAWDVPAHLQWVKAPGNLAPALFLPLVGMSLALWSNDARLTSGAAVAQARRALAIIFVAGIGLHLLDSSGMPDALGIFDAIGLSLLVAVACISTPWPVEVSAVVAVGMYAAHIALLPSLTGAALMDVGVPHGLSMALLRQDAGFPVLSWAPFVLLGYLVARWLRLRPLVDLGCKKRRGLVCASALGFITAVVLWGTSGAPEKWIVNPSYAALAVGWLFLNVLLADAVAPHLPAVVLSGVGNLGRWSIALVGVNWFLFQSLPMSFGVVPRTSIAASMISMAVGVASGYFIAKCMRSTDRWIRRCLPVWVLSTTAVLVAAAGLFMLFWTEWATIWLAVGLGLSLLAPYALTARGDCKTRDPSV